MAKISPRFVAGLTWAQEVPSGTIDGVNAAFSLVNAPIQSLSILLFKTGLLQAQVGASGNYSVSGKIITMTTPPQVGEDLYAIYQF